MAANLEQLPNPFQGEPPDREKWVLGQELWFNPERLRKNIGAPERCWPVWLKDLSLAGSRHPRWPCIRREDLFAHCGQANTPDLTLQAYVAIVAWGAGSSARSQSRALKPLREAHAKGQLPTAGEDMLGAVDAARAGSPVDAYKALHGTDGNGGDRRVAFLGPAYGTKLLYFCAYNICEAAGQQPPLIFDSNVAQAVRWLTNLDWNSGNWSADTYRTYLDLASSWAQQWRTTPDVVERVLFDVGRSQKLAVTSLSAWTCRR